MKINFTLKIKRDVGIMTGSRDIPPYVTITPLEANFLISSLALFPPTQFKASFGAGTSLDLINSVVLNHNTQLI